MRGNEHSRRIAAVGRPALLLALLAAASSACRSSGDEEDGAAEGTESDGSGGDDGGSDGSGGDPAACEGGEILSGAAPLRRLTHWEYDNTIRDLLGDDARLGEGFPTETSATGFDNQAAALGVGALLAEDYMRAAEEIAARAVEDTSALLPCDPAAMGETPCAEAFIHEFAPRAYRRPLTDAQRERLVSLFAAAHEEHGFTPAISMLLEAMLQSPYFLYRVEIGMPDPDASGAVPLDDWEIASRLSYLLWGSMPDAELFAAAADGTLQTPEAIAAQAERMLDDPRAREAVASFHRQWLRLTDIETMNKDATLFPEVDDELRASMQGETETFLEHVVFDAEGDFTTMLTASYGFVDARLAALYGVPAPAGTGLQKVEMPAGQRAGLLTQAAILAITAKPDQSSPVQRGAFVRDRLLCETLPEPPPGVDTTPPEIDPNATTRERYEQHATDPSCAGCHRLIDPIGFTFENYDAIGRWRDMEGGIAVDASGAIVGTPDGDLEVDGALELATLLADRQEVRDCFVEQWFTFAHGRAPEAEDECSVETLRGGFAAADGDVASLLVALTQTAAFRYRPGGGS